MDKSKTLVTLDEIELCGYCEGKGTQSSKICTNEHKREFEIKVSECYNCAGKGRMRKITIIEYKQL